jgi:hypothetical protein
MGYTDVVHKTDLREDVCKDWLVDAAMTLFLSALASIVTAVTNVVLLILILAFAELERHMSVSSLNSSVMFKVAVSQFLNMAVIVFLLNWDGLVFSGDFKDFNRGWYAVVGSILCVNLFLNSFTGAMAKVAMHILVVLKRCPCCTRRARHQAELIALFENPDFDISSRYAGILSTCFCTLTYSPGLPILNFFAMVFMFLNFWVDKWLLLRGSKLPPSYDTQMPKECTELLLWAVPLHFFLAIFMYSNACTVPSKGLGGSLGSLANSAQSAAGSGVSGMSSNSLGDRISRESTWMSFVALMIVLTLMTLWLLMLIFGATIGNVIKACRATCFPKRVQTLPELEGEELSFERSRAYLEMSRGFASYRMEANPTYTNTMRELRQDIENKTPTNQAAIANSSSSQPALPGGGDGSGSLPDPSVETMSN